MERQSFAQDESQQALAAGVKKRPLFKTLVTEVAKSVIHQIIPILLLQLNESDIYENYNQKMCAYRRGRGRTDDERVAVLEADLPRLRDRAEALLIHAASRAELFDCRFTAPQLRKMLKDALGQKARPLSILQKRKREIVQIKTRKSRNQRADVARRKALLGGFMVAQFRHKPELHAELAPDLRAHLAEHPKPEMAKANIAFMAAILSNLSCEEDPVNETAVTGISPEQARRNQTRRMILIGAWVLDRRSEQPTIEALIQNELSGFLRQGRASARNIALLNDAVGVF